MTCDCTDNVTSQTQHIECAKPAMHPSVLFLSMRVCCLLLLRLSSSSIGSFHCSVLSIFDRTWTKPYILRCLALHGAVRRCSTLLGASWHGTSIGPRLCENQSSKYKSMLWFPLCYAFFLVALFVCKAHVLTNIRTYHWKRQPSPMPIAI